jgi:hypothetical protein
MQPMMLESLTKAQIALDRQSYELMRMVSALDAAAEKTVEQTIAVHSLMRNWRNHQERVEQGLAVLTRDARELADILSRDS